MGILRDGLYTDKILAILREYGSNAWDAHREAGKPDKPIKVTLPTQFEPTLVIRDWGPGLSEDDVFLVYTKYGRSTKRNTDDAVGMLGIGSKSGFAYSDQFTVTSWHGGAKKIYLAVLDPSDKGEMNKLHEEPCDPSETGIEIKIPVQPVDVFRFHEKARALFTYYDPQPEINLDLPKPEWTATKHGFVYDDDKNLDQHHPSYGTPREWVAVMGCVPYKLDVNQIRAELEEEELWSLVLRVRGGLYCDIGEVRISANREELKYTEKTKAAIVKKFRLLLDEFIADLFSQITDKTLSNWERRHRAVFIGKTLAIKVPSEHVKWATGQVTVWSNNREGMNPEPKTFRLQREKTAVRSIRVHRAAHVYVYDDDRKLEGYRLNHLDTLVIPKPGTKIKDVKAELEQYLKDAELDGIPVDLISKRVSWYTPYQDNTSRPTNKKHHVRTFQLKARVSNWGAYSNNWEIVTREPTDDDVFVVISHFKAVCGGGGSAFYSQIEDDRKLARWLGIDFPEVYAYKTTAKKPLTPEDCKGTHYPEWRRGFFRRALYRDESYEDEKRLKTFQLWRWWTVFSNGYSNPRIVRHLEKYLERFTDELGEKHPITHVLRKYKQAVKVFDKVNHHDRDMYRQLAGTIKIRRRPAPKKALDDINNAYPLLAESGHGNLGVFTLPDRHSEPWFDYIKLVDRDRAKAGSN